MKKANLKSAKQDLLNLFPINLDGLAVYVPINSEDDLHMIFYQKNTYDERRNFNIAFSSFKGIKTHQERKEKLDDIYLANWKFIQCGLLGLNDKLLLDINLENEVDLDSVAYICNVNRHQDSNLKGVGKNFYKNLRNYLLQKDFNYVSCIPANSELQKKVWSKYGFKSLREFEDKEKFKKYLINNEQRDYYYIDKLK